MDLSNMSNTMRAAAAQEIRGTPSAQAWFAGGERVGYDPRTRAVTTPDAPLKIFLRREGHLAHAVTFLPGYPDGSFGWAKVLQHLPNAVEMPKLFVEYVGMGDSDKPKDYAYSTAERTDLVEALWRAFNVQSSTLVAFDFSSLVVLEHLRRRLERAERGDPVGGPAIRESSSSMAAFSRTVTLIRGSPRRSFAASPTGLAGVWDDPLPYSSYWRG
jgi:pimeloyl-ACP methyl ester carboxylesterase